MLATVIREGLSEEVISEPRPERPGGTCQTKERMWNMPQWTSHRGRKGKQIEQGFADQVSDRVFEKCNGSLWWVLNWE